MEHKTNITKLITFIPTLFIALFIIAYFSPISRAQSTCGQGAPCRGSQYCEMSCPSPPNAGACSFSCVGGPGGGGGWTQCPAGTAVSWTPSYYYCGAGMDVTWERAVGCCEWSGEAGDRWCKRYKAYRQVGWCAPIIPVKPITGYVWEDLNGNNVMDMASDKFWGKLAQASCSTSTSTAINVRDNAATANASFACSAGKPLYTTTPHAASASLTFTLTPPTGVSCGANTPVAWAYTVCENAACTQKHTGSGTGCTATILNSSGSYTNTLNWRLNNVISRTITGSVHETDDPTTCNQTTPLTLPSLSVSAFDGVTPKGSPASVSTTDGTYSLTGLVSTDSVSSLCVNGSLSDATKSYQLSCVSGSGMTCSVGSGACAINCTPTNALAAGNATLFFGFEALSNDKWLSVIDGDIYADSITQYVASSPIGGFSPNLINTQTDQTIGGYGFAASTIDTQATGTNVSEQGGAAKRLAILPAYPPTDGWLNKFSFTPPTAAITTPPSGNTFKEGSVYSFTVDQFNQILSTGVYSFEGGNAGSPSAAIVYVTGSGSINIANDFISQNNDKTLLLATTADVVITKDPGTTTASYTATGASQIDLVIISQKDINLESQYVASTTNDNPLMIYGSLVSAGTINPERNLGFIDNSNYPATSIRFYPYLLSLIQSYELAATEAGPYTGLATIDVQFDYGQ